MAKDIVKISRMTPREAVERLDKAIDHLTSSINFIPKNALNYSKDIEVTISAIKNISIAVNKLQGLQRRIKTGK